jgi:hypothetical protein
MLRLRHLSDTLVVLAAGATIACVYRATPSGHKVRLSSGREVLVARQELESGPPRVFHFEYLTSLNTEDRTQVWQEMRGLWPDVRKEAERLQADEVWIKAWDSRWRLRGNHLMVAYIIKGDHEDLYTRRADDGSWK